MPSRIPLSTYRLQLNSEFTFSQATEVIPYLQALGVTHCYSSPFLKARPGSPHGYDIVDHNSLNPEIGDSESFDRLASTLKQHGMGQILDIVPNHMGVGGDNSWWLDVLENGPSSPYASFFDIDWRPVKEELRGKVLLPVLGDHYGVTLEKGEFALKFSPDQGDFSVHYYEHRFPLDPHTYPLLLSFKPERLEHEIDDSELLVEFQSLITAFGNLPSRADPNTENQAVRLRDKDLNKRRLADLYTRSPSIRRFLDTNIDIFNGDPGQPESFDHLHRLLEAQAYRLAYWRVASDEINYRRFFDINDLAGLRMENPDVFDATHRFILSLVTEGKLDGLRIDHPDGLYDPLQYCAQLRERLQEATPKAGGQETEFKGLPCYVVVEKILATYEHLREDWPVHGTTGYNFSHFINGLFVYPGSEPALTRLYTRFIGHPLDFDQLLYERKRLIILTQLSSELTVLTNLVDAIAQSERHTRDFTRNGLRAALTEVVACFPVYRTYITEAQVTEDDRRFVRWAVAKAKASSPAADTSIFDFLGNILLREELTNPRPGYLRSITRFALKFQQYTAPVMAKGLEDTTFYIYNRLVSLNDVGGNPRNFSVSPTAFHRANQERQQHWPLSMIATSTHDSKRSEDVRARINVLSELPAEWRKHLSRWSRINRKKKVPLAELTAPSRNDEYLLYQTLIGAWPLHTLDQKGLEGFRERIEVYLMKALREAKVHTSWINPNIEYENATLHFVRSLLGNVERNAFLTDFLPFQRLVARCGLFNSLTQTLFKLLAPGVPDIYQGNELWRFDLVDPDNRRPVDYARRQRMLHELSQAAGSSEPLTKLTATLLDSIEDGAAKLYVNWRALQLRKQFPEVMLAGDYLSLTPEGEKADHICAFARQHESRTVVAIGGRWFARLLPNEAQLPVGETWGDTRLELPAGTATSYTNILDGQPVRVEDSEGKSVARLAGVLANFPVALLVSAD